MSSVKTKKQVFRINGKPSSKTPEYCAWSNMVQRCTNDNHKEYKHYGERGISVCKEWIGTGGFINFYNDVGARPSKRMTLERIDCNGNYEPSNVTWASTKVQALNKRMRCDNKSGYRGVSWNKVASKWTARIHIADHYAFLGNFEEAIDAAIAYDVASLQVFGGVGKLNILGDMK